MNKIVKKTIAGVSTGVVVLYTLPLSSIASTESVFAKLNNKGENYKTIVSIKEDDEVNQTEQKKELPLEAKITYKLNGTEIKPEELAGRSGKVTVNIEYINKSSKYVNVNGRSELMYTPFVVAVGTIINNKNNTNIKVTNGKVIENSGKSIVCGVLLPGMEESLKLSNNLTAVEIPSNIEITMDTTNFEMGNIMCYASPKVLDGTIDWNKFNNLFESTNLLQQSSNQIEEGAKKLHDGTIQLKEGTETLSNGIETAYNGSATIKSEIEKSINSMNSTNNASKENTLDDKLLNQIGAKAKTSANSTISSQLNIIGDSAKAQAVASIEQQLEGIGKAASNQAASAITAKQAIITKNAEQAVKTGMQAKKEELAAGIQKYVASNKDNLISEKHISEAVENSTYEDITEIVTYAATAGATEGAKVAGNAISGIKANAGEVNVDVSNISVKVNYEDLLNNNVDYNNLDDSQKAIIESIAKQVAESAEKEAENQAKNQAKTSAENAVKIVKDNAEKSATQSAQIAVSEIAKQSATVAAKTAAGNTTKQIINNAVNTGVNDAMNQLVTNFGKDTSFIENAFLPYVGQIANETAKQVAGEVAESTAKATAKQVAEGVASQTAQSVAVQISGTVAENTAKTVANQVANEVKEEATKQIKAQMETLLNTGISPLTEGLAKLNIGAQKLNAGSAELENGSKTLAEGISEFNVKGIDKITGIINNDLNSLVIRGKKLEELANEYSQFTADKKQENVKFISIVDSIKSSKQFEDDGNYKKEN